MGGFDSNILHVHPYLGKSSNLTSIFFKWVKKPPPRIFGCIFTCFLLGVIGNISARGVTLTWFLNDHDPKGISKSFWGLHLREGNTKTAQQMSVL